MGSEIHLPREKAAAWLGRPQPRSLMIRRTRHNLSIVAMCAGAPEGLT